MKIEIMNYENIVDVQNLKIAVLPKLIHWYP